MSPLRFRALVGLVAALVALGCAPSTVRAQYCYGGQCYGYGGPQYYSAGYGGPQYYGGPQFSESLQFSRSGGPQFYSGGYQPGYTLPAYGGPQYYSAPSYQPQFYSAPAYYGSPVYYGSPCPGGRCGVGLSLRVGRGVY